MAIRKIHTDLDFNSNSLKNFHLEHRNDDPEPLDGSLYYNSLLKEFRGCREGEWGPFSSKESFWHLDPEGNLVTAKKVIIKNTLVVEGDTGSGGAGESPIIGITGVKLNGQIYRDEDADGIIDLGTIISGGGGLTSVSWDDIQGKPTSLSAFTNDMGFITASSLANYQPLSTAINTNNIRNHAPSLTGEGATGNWNVRSAALYAPYKNSTTISEVAETLRYHATIPSSFASWCTGYNNAVLNISRYPETGYSSQLGFSGGGMYYRHQNKGTWGEWKTVAFTDSTVANATKLDGKSLLVGTWNGIPSITGGVMEIGRYIDFHHTADSGLDYTTRLTAPIVDAPCIVTLPSSAGTLALLTSTVSSAKKLVAGDGTDAVYVAASGNVAIGQTADSGYKLDVNGTMRVRNSTVCANGLSVSHELWGESLIVTRSSIDGSAVVTFKNNGGFLGWIGVGGSASSDPYKPIFADRNYNNYVIIHSGIISEQSVKEATKLKTSRKIFGVDFDGTKDINGNAAIEGDLVVNGDIASGGGSWEVM